MIESPANDALEARKKIEAVELCGKNRGPHDYIPIEWLMTPEFKRVTRLLCLKCFSHVTMAHIMERYPDVSY